MSQTLQIISGDGTVYAQRSLASRDQALAEVGLPEGMFQAVPIGHDTAAAVMQAEPVRMLCFTGSVCGGRAVQQAVGGAGGFPGTGLELGSKDPAYVRADADVAHAGAGIADGAFFNAGQSCCSIERVHVHESVYDQFLDAAAAPCLWSATST